MARDPNQQAPTSHTHCANRVRHFQNTKYPRPNGISVLMMYCLSKTVETTLLLTMCESSDSMMAVPMTAVSKCPKTVPVARSRLIVLVVGTSFQQKRVMETCSTIFFQQSVNQ